MHRNMLLHMLADLEQRIAFCEAELAYRRARLDRVGQATREAIDAVAGNSASAARAQGQVSTLLPRAVDDGGRSYPT